MTRPSQLRFVVHCVLSNVAAGSADQGRVYDVSLDDTLCTTFHSLIDGDYLMLKLQIPENPLPVWVHLARVTWVQGSRFGVELLLMDVNERIRLSHFTDERPPLQLELDAPRSELTITAAE